MSAPVDDLFSQLSRAPDFDAPELRAYDSADRLLLETAAAVRGSSGFARGVGALIPGRVVVIGDRHGALTLGAVAVLGAAEVRVHQDPLLARRALDANARRLGLEGRYSQHELDSALLTGATLVLMQLPRSLSELEQIAWSIARHAEPDVTVLAGGRDKHMSRGMNDVLSRYFADVSAGLGKRKARVLTAQSPRPGFDVEEPPFPVRGSDPELEFDLAAFGATFGGATLDHGSRLLLRTLREDPPGAPPRRVLDLGCGNGVLATWAARAYARAEILATDQSAAALAATKLTATWAGVADRVRVDHADGTEAVPEGWADIVLLNPPFHSGAIVHAGVGRRLVREAAQALAPGGELRLVFNSHLAYQSLVSQVVGPVAQLARDRTFTVLRAIKKVTKR